MTTEISDNWYENFFQGINCEIWENALPAEWTRQETDFLVRELNLQPGQHILDIPCGFGRHAIELSQRGFRVTGVDISATFIKKLIQEIKERNLNIRPIQADILAVHLDDGFSGAVCLGNSFGYFSIEKMKIFIEKVAGCLDTGARFIINSAMIAESILPNFANYARNRSHTIGNITMDVTNIYNAREGYMMSKLFYTKEGRAEEHAFKHYIFTLNEVKRLLNAFGLRMIATYSSIFNVEYNHGDQQIYMIAEKE